MKTYKMNLWFLCLGLLFFLSTSAYAQDLMKVAPDVVKKVLIDNDQVRVLEIEFPAGYTETWHSHPNHIMYPLTDGTVEITEKGKGPVVSQIKANNPTYGSATVHMVKNIGNTTVKMIVTEIKPSKNEEINAEVKPESKD